MTPSKQVKDLYDKNFKFLKKETKEDIRKLKELPRSSIGKVNIVKMAVLPKAIYRFSAIAIKNPRRFFTDLKRRILYTYLLALTLPKIIHFLTLIMFDA